MRLTVARALLAATQWQPLVAVALAGVAVVEVARLAGHPDGALMQAGRYSLVVAAACAALVIDDPAASTLAASPMPLSVRRAQRLALAGASLALGALPVMVRAGLIGGRLPSRLQFDGALEIAVYAAFGCAVAATASRWGHEGSAGIAGACAVMVAFTTSVMLPSYARLFPATPFAEDARGRLLLNLAAATAVLIWSSSDPAVRWSRWWWRGAWQHGSGHQGGVRERSTQ